MDADEGAGRDATGGGGGAAAAGGAGGGEGSRGGVIARGGGAAAGVGVGLLKEEAGVDDTAAGWLSATLLEPSTKLAFPWAPPNPWLGLKLVVGLEATGFDGVGAELLYFDPLDSWIRL